MFSSFPMSSPPTQLFHVGKHRVNIAAAVARRPHPSPRPSYRYRVVLNVSREPDAGANDDDDTSQKSRASPQESPNRPVTRCVRKISIPSPQPYGT